VKICAIGLLLALCVTGRAEFPVPEAPFAPRQYRCPHISTSPVVDGRLDDACWEEAPWSKDFVDIRGSAWPVPAHKTRVMMLWGPGDTLYIGAELEEPDLWATYARHDMVIYHENDFEMFIDPDGDNHNYYELEINALGTTWDLLLTRPYRDDGQARDDWEWPGLRSAVHLDGTLNDPSDRDRGWSVELAFPLSDLGNLRGSYQPWRINFSRVQWHRQVVDGRYFKQRDPVTGDSLPEDNWVWSPQGLVAMHYPERWGLLFLSSKSEMVACRGCWNETEVAVGEKLMQVYYAQRRARERGGRFVADPPGVGQTPLPRGNWSPVAVEADSLDFRASTDNGHVRLSVDGQGRLLRETARREAPNPYQVVWVPAPPFTPLTWKVTP
jgi:hypothetical protein